MKSDEDSGPPALGLIERATSAFLKIEIFAYVVLGLLLALTAMFGVASAVASLWASVSDPDGATSIVVTVDRLLFVLMLVEILHTVRVSFRSGTLVCEPFLIVGLIASIRRVLAITLESSQASEPGKWTPSLAAMLQSTMIELSVLGALILIMVISIVLLRYSNRFPHDG
jgi:uncharacterized membrane protein (DUF373 family)